MVTTRRWAVGVGALLATGLAVALVLGGNARWLALGAGLGLILAFALAWLLGRADERVRTVHELEEVFGLPVVARVPRSQVLRRHPKQGGPDRFLETDSGSGPEAEAFRGLRTSLRYLSIDRELRSLAVVSPASGDGRSTVARALAATMAAMGDSVVLVDADLRKTDENSSSVEPGRSGLSQVLAGSDLDDALTEAPVGSDPQSQESRALAQLPSGPLPVNPVQLLDGARMGWLVQELESRFDRVIIDTPATARASDAMALIPEVSGVLVVAGIGNTPRGSALDLRKQLGLQDVTPVGIVANFAGAKGDQPPFEGT